MNTSGEQDKKCANTPCQCAPRSWDAYCSDYCKHTATSGVPRVETTCRCAHEGCVAAASASSKPSG